MAYGFLAGGPILIAGVVNVLLAAGFALVGLGRRPLRAFALVLLLTGAWMVAYGVGQLAGDSEAARFWYRVGPWFYIPYGFAVLHFGSVYLIRRPHRAWRRWGWLLWLALGILFDVLYGLKPALFWDLSGPLLDPGGPLFDPDVPRGWLTLLPLFAEIFIVATALFLARDYVRLPPGPVRASALLVSLGFFAPAACACLVMRVVARIQTGVPFGTTPVHALADTVFAIEMAGLLALVAYLAALANRKRDSHLNTYLAWFLGILLGSALFTWIAMAGMLGIPLTVLGPILAGLFRFLGALFVAYGLLRLHLFDLDLKIRWGVSRGALVAGVLVAFFLAQEGAEAFVSQRWGPWIGLGSAGAATAALLPLRSRLERAVDRLLRDSAAPEHLRYRRLEVYRAALEDNAATFRTDEEATAHLAELRRRLGITDQEHRILSFMQHSYETGLPAKVLKRFRIQRRLGRGSTGIAYLARDNETDQLVKPYCLLGFSELERRPMSPGLS